MLREVCEKTFLQHAYFLMTDQIIGMDELNGTEHKVEVVKSDALKIGPTAEMKDYQGGGVVRQKKMPVTCTFVSLRESLKAPKFDENMHGDFLKACSSLILHHLYLNQSTADVLSAHHTCGPCGA